jgi:hypothetical protein
MTMDVVIVRIYRVAIVVQVNVPLLLEERWTTSVIQSDLVKSRTQRLENMKIY